GARSTPQHAWRPATPARSPTSSLPWRSSAKPGPQAALPAMLKIPAEAQRAGGHFTAAQATIVRALAVSAETGQPYFDADLHRLDGDLVRALGGPADEALPARPRHRPRAGRPRVRAARRDESRRALAR